MLLYKAQSSAQKHTDFHILPQKHRNKKPRGDTMRKHLINGCFKDFCGFGREGECLVILEVVLDKAEKPQGKDRQTEATTFLSCLRCPGATCKVTETFWPPLKTPHLGSPEESLCASFPGNRESLNGGSHMGTIVYNCALLRPFGPIFTSPFC